MTCGNVRCKPAVSPDTSTIMSPETLEVRSSSTVDRDGKSTCCDVEGTLELPVNRSQVASRSTSNTESLNKPNESRCCGVESSVIYSADTKNELCDKRTDKGKEISKSGIEAEPMLGTCCAPEPTQTIHKEDCSSVVELATQGYEEFNRPRCCKLKASPCCDTSCLDRIALRECESGDTRPGLRRSGSRGSIRIRASPEARGSCQGMQNGKACGHHSRKVLESYAATLDALGCICRALLALGQESCCLPPGRLPTTVTRSKKKTPLRCSSAESCCTKVASTSMSVAECSIKRGPRSPTCSRGGRPAGNTACDKTCFAKPVTVDVAKSCEDACCFDGNAQTPKGTLTETASVSPDPEKSLPGQEHVILSISGMTCTGCETKLQRTLGAVESVKNLKTSLILARAEFDLDLHLGSISDVMKHLERTTEFKCERVSSQGSIIDLIASYDSHQFMDRSWPKGVTDMRAVDKNTVSVTFDPKIVGARDLVEKGWESPLQLAPLRDNPTLEAGGKHVRHVGWMTLLSIFLTIPVLVMAWAPLPKREIAYNSVSLGLATIVQLVIAGPFYSKALKSLIFSKMIEMDLLIVLSTTAAYVFSIVSFGYLVAGRPLPTDQFFETSTLLVTLIMVGRYVSALARQKAVESISIHSLQESTAVLVGESGDLEVDIRLLQYGDIFKVTPDARIPTDGTIISGASEIDESMITGESNPVPKYIGSRVIAGSINGSGMLHVRLTRLLGDNTVSTIAGMVDEAKLSKPEIQDIADRVASYFVPVVVTLTVLTFVIWVAVGVGIRNQTGAEATVQAITYAITVLIVSCPCAIGLAVPMVIVISGGISAERGVVFKSADSIEVAHRTSHVVFDKTGTLTEGKLSINQEIYTKNDCISAKSLLLGLVRDIKHPVSIAVANQLKGQGILPSSVSDISVVTGKGVEGTSSGLVLRAGNTRWLNLSSDAQVQPMLSQGYTVFCFTINDSLAAIFTLEDTLRPESASTVTTLLERGISVHIVSGDDYGAVRSIAGTLQIPVSNVHSRCTPADKRTYIENLLSQSSNNPRSTQPVVIFCGDGTNDAVALSAATIGVHMNEGTDVAKSAADIVLMRPSVSGILTIIGISRKSINRIRFNFGWSFVYNLFAILLGAGAFVNARIPPEFAGLGELVSVVPVVVAAVALRFERL